MRFQGAVIKEQGQTFAVVVVKGHIINDVSQSENAIREFMPAFGGIPVVLAAQVGGRMTYRGRPDIAKFLSNVSAARIPWREYSLS